MTRRSELDNLAVAVLELLGPNNDDAWGIGIDGKRPFGFSMGVEADILDAAGVVPKDSKDELTPEQEAHASALWEEIPVYIFKRFKRLLELAPTDLDECPNCTEPRLVVQPDGNGWVRYTYKCGAVVCEDVYEKHQTWNLDKSCQQK